MISHEALQLLEPTGVNNSPSAFSTYPNMDGSALQSPPHSDPTNVRLNARSDSSVNWVDTSVENRKGAPATTTPLPQSTEISRAYVSPVELLAEWNGCVTVVEDGPYFMATLKGILGEGVKGEEEDATIPVSDVSEWDKDLLRPGNFFRLCVIYEILPSGQPRRSTQVVFRRLPAYRQHDLDTALERGRELARGLRVE